jgi:hypothetical protein
MYYPLSQITINLYSNGELWYKSNLQPYVGYYFKTSKGEYFTGKTPSDSPNVLLIDPITIETTTSDIPDNYKVDSVFFTNDPGVSLDIALDPLYNETVVNNYVVLKQNSVSNIPTYLPYYNPQLPTQQNYQNAEFRRFFCKKTNEIIYTEINKDQYDKLVNKNPQILWQLYLPFNITWQLTGDKQQVAQVNKNMVELSSFKLKLPYFNLYLKEDYTKYYQ